MEICGYCKDRVLVDKCPVCGAVPLPVDNQRKVELLENKDKPRPTKEAIVKAKIKGNPVKPNNVPIVAPEIPEEIILEEKPDKTEKAIVHKQPKLAEKVEIHDREITVLKTKISRLEPKPQKPWYQSVGIWICIILFLVMSYVVYAFVMQEMGHSVLLPSWMYK